MQQVADRVEQGGVDAWYALDAAELLGDEAAHYDKVTDILDVWFDSGVTHECVLAGARLRQAGRPVPGRLGPASRLVPVLAADRRGDRQGARPYRQCLTHGFTVDEQGRKMSKSLGNGIEPQDIMKTLGADILRLWIASADYSNEMSLSQEILKRNADAYRRIRNTARFLLGNLHGFDPARAPASRWTTWSRWTAGSCIAPGELQEKIAAAYERYDFAAVVQALLNFCSVDLGSLYLDVTKDRLYTMPVDSRGRR